ncbi:MAG TPA: hypothetical protein VM186_14720 [Planctomycetota bacterium]|nr:hypothetical protein [Planctomycetota bacterium]
MTPYLVALLAGVPICTLAFTAVTCVLARFSERFRPMQANLLDTMILRFIPIALILMMFALAWTWYITGDTLYTRSLLSVLYLLAMAGLTAEYWWILDAGWVQAILITVLGGILGGACIFGLIKLLGELGMRLDCL